MEATAMQVDAIAERIREFFAFNKSDWTARQLAEYIASSLDCGCTDDFKCPAHAGW